MPGNCFILVGRHSRPYTANEFSVIPVGATQELFSDGLCSNHFLFFFAREKIVLKKNFIFLLRPKKISLFVETSRPHLLLSWYPLSVKFQSSCACRNKT